MEKVALTAPSTQPTPLDPVQPGAGVGSEYKEYKPLYERFGAKEGVASTDKAFSELWEWAKEKAELKDKQSVMWEVTKLLNRLGSPSVGDKPWSKALVYVQTSRQMRQAEERLKQLETRL